MWWSDGLVSDFRSDKLAGTGERRPWLEMAAFCRLLRLPELRPGLPKSLHKSCGSIYFYRGCLTPSDLWPVKTENCRPPHRRAIPAPITAVSRNSGSVTCFSEYWQWHSQHTAENNRKIPGSVKFEDYVNGAQCYSIHTPLQTEQCALADSLTCDCNALPHNQAQQRIPGHSRRARWKLLAKHETNVFQRTKE